ncbi:hypothetical protein T10_1577 [Trichinella papuae]|uniref:Uncharacterized protein n=1 Tax=Trichinella papuae TaxID=268474 RepID=A0A0V1M111_9BILA|nr:hypothetical protein T10_1577 [Trichinella papuae]
MSGESARVDEETLNNFNGFRKTGFPINCLKNSKMRANELLKVIEKLLRLTKTDGSSAINLANECEEIDADAADENHSITTEKIISHKQFAAYLEKMKSFAVQKQPQLLRHVQHLETAFETTCYAEATHQTTLEQYLL